MEGSASFTRRRTSSPFISGILMSRITRSGWYRGGSASERHRHGGRIERMVAEIPDEVRECLAELRRIDLHVQRCGLARDVDADGLAGGVAALDIRHGLVNHAVDVHYPEV